MVATTAAAVAVTMVVEEVEEGEDTLEVSVTKKVKMKKCDNCKDSGTK